jgi:predicted TIM-barrel fold metal-dependent hydrolase
MTETPTGRLLAALADPDHLYDRAQVAWVVQMDREARGDDPNEPGFRDLVWRAAFEAGYQARVDEENERYRYEVQSAEQDPSFTRFAAVVDARRAADREAALPREGDFPGGWTLPSRE